ncbi:MAG TPA: TolC family protein [Opitutaceae bacterium]|nr:TolC family protein [Opitutaceae bacterium]
MNLCSRLSLLRTIALTSLIPSIGLAQSNEAPPPLPHPLTLDVALAYAVEHNPTLRRVKDQIQEQEGVVVETRARNIPNVRFSGNYTTQQHTLIDQLFGLSVGQPNAWQVDLVARQTVYSGGSIRSAIASEKDQLAAAKLAVSSTLNDTLLNVRENFYAVLLSREQIQVEEEALRVLEAELANAKSRRSAGTGSEFDRLRAEVSVANVRPALIRARNHYRISQEQLRQSLGAPATGSVGSEIEADGSLIVPLISPSLEDVVAASRLRRPELLRQDKTIQAAESRIDVARGDYYPSLSVFGGYRWEKSNFTGNRLEGWNTGVQADWAIFDGRATAGKVQQARARLQQAKHTKEEISLSIDVQVRQAYSGLTEASELLQASEKVVEQARESLRLSQSRYGAGSATQLDVLQAQSALTEARTNLAQAQHDYAVAVARLRRAMGETEITP